MGSLEKADVTAAMRFAREIVMSSAWRIFDQPGDEHMRKTVRVAIDGYEKALKQRLDIKGETL